MLLASVITLTNVGAQPAPLTGTDGMALRAKMPARSLARFRNHHALVADGKGQSDRAQLRSSDIQYPFSLQGEAVMVEVLLRLAPGTSAADVISDGTVLVSVGSIVGARVPASSVSGLALDPRVRAIELPSLVQSPRTNASVAEIRADQVHAGTNGLPPTTGQGVILGVIDTGLDVTHPDFSGDAGSRVLYLWDISDPDASQTPDYLPYGREYSKADIDANPAGIGQKDINGHGTHVAGAAAGNGRGNAALRGVAPDADLIIVKGVRGSDPNAGFSELDVIAGCEYIFNRAALAGKPAVVNLSLGSAMTGSHDGTTLYEEALSSLTGQGRIIVAAAGNDGERMIHAGSTISEWTNPEFLFAAENVCLTNPGFCPGTPGYALSYADIWYTQGAIDGMAIAAYAVSPQGLTLTALVPLTLGQTYTAAPIVKEDGTPLAFLDFVSSPDPQSNGDGNMYVSLSNNGEPSVDPSSLLWSFTFSGAGDGRVDLWGSQPMPDIGVQVPIQVGTGAVHGDHSVMISTPAAGKSIISVGSYVTKNSWTGLDGTTTRETALGSLSSFSSNGPTRDGRIAPFISAPGEMIFAARTSTAADNMTANIPANVLEGGRYVGMQGTSMASPHVAGVVALMLQARPNLSAVQVGEILAATARHDAFNPVPDNGFGIGKVDALAAVQGAVTSVADHDVLVDGTRLSPNPVVATFAYRPRWTSSSFRVIGVDGTRHDVPSRPGADGSVIVETSTLAPGTYLLQEWSTQGVQATPFVRLR